jgi:hypothetical protein
MVVGVRECRIPLPLSREGARPRLAGRRSKAEEPRPYLIES